MYNSKGRNKSCIEGKRWVQIFRDGCRGLALNIYLKSLAEALPQLQRKLHCTQKRKLEAFFARHLITLDKNSGLRPIILSTQKIILNNVNIICPSIATLITIVTHCHQDWLCC